MTKKDKLIQKILENKTISTDQAITLLLYFGYEERSGKGSHVTYTKAENSMTLVRERKELLLYQLKHLKTILESEGYTNE